MISRRKFLASTTTTTAATAAGLQPIHAGEPLYAVGLIADAQYANAEPGGIRHYRNSIGKLGQAAAAINEAGVDFSIHLGDLIDRDFASFDDILEPLNTLEKPVHQILGNHDFSVAEDRKPEVAKKMGIDSPYYAFSKQGIRFVFLDGTEISTFAQPKGTEIFEEATAMLAEFKAKGR
jgi:hypothetical protein